MAFRASCKTLVDGAEAIVLHRMAGAPEDLYAILNENIKLPRDQRAFMNQELLTLLVPEERAGVRDADFARPGSG